MADVAALPQHGSRDGTEWARRPGVYACR